MENHRNVITTNRYGLRQKNLAGSTKSYKNTGMFITQKLRQKQLPDSFQNQQKKVTPLEKLKKITNLLASETISFRVKTQRKIPNYNSVTVDMLSSEFIKSNLNLTQMKNNQQKKSHSIFPQYDSHTFQRDLLLNYFQKYSKPHRKFFNTSFALPTKNLSQEKMPLRRSQQQEGLIILKLNPIPSPSIHITKTKNFTNHHQITTKMNIQPLICSNQQAHPVQQNIIHPRENKNEKIEKHEKEQIRKNKKNKKTSENSVAPKQCYFNYVKTNSCKLKSVKVPIDNELQPWESFPQQEILF